MRIDPRATGAAFGVAMLGVGRAALAADETPVLSYVASPGCPSGAEFAAAIESRGRHVEIVADESSPAMSVAIDRQSRGGYRGRLRIGPAAQALREIRGATCELVVDALAVVVVSALAPGGGPVEGSDASAAQADDREQDRPTREVAPAPPSGSPSGAIASGSPRGQEGPSLAPARGAVSTPPAPGPVSAAPAAVSVSAGTVKFETRNSMTVLGGATMGLIPSVVLPRFDFTWSRTNLVAMPDGHRYSIFPTVQVYGSVFGQGVGYHSRYGTTVSNGIGGGMRLCAPLHYDESGLRFHLCGDVMIGFFGVETLTGPSNDIRLEGVGTAGLAADLAYNFGRHFHLGLEVEGFAILGPLSASASDGSTIFKSSVIGGSALLGAGVQF